MNRSLTLPKTGPDTWTNAVTSTRIERDRSYANTVYSVRSMTSLHVSRWGTLADARLAAKQWAEGTLRMWDEAHTEALDEDARRSQARRDADHAEALRLNYARDYYAHAGYRPGLTRAELSAGYADWDAGNASPADRREALAVSAGSVEPTDRDAFEVVFASLTPEQHLTGAAKRSARAALTGDYPTALREARSAAGYRDPGPVVVEPPAGAQTPLRAGRPAGWRDAWLEVRHPAQMDLVHGPMTLDSWAYLSVRPAALSKPGPY